MIRTHLGITYVDGQRRAHRTDHKRDLCIMACVFCKDPLFQQWLQEQIEAMTGPLATKIDEDGAKAFILKRCKVASRNDLDTDQAAGRLFMELVRAPYLAWKEAQP